ncbi:hypothetical protein [Nocardioides panaciterrulae]|uniref:Uncharacterized protein n=1 Tax=Nocardioides panaciterrulae TaxID=661492 RepID=A0A7Y9E8X8_9ACTN|nr:hypothetical protein [Nocardioides panaciterrulae]NYD43414.1 hypothetical protein [Nocardioides panaciterrulae]
MTAVLEPTWTGLVDDAAIFPPGNADLADAATAHLERRHTAYADLVGSLVVRDTDLPQLRGCAARVSVVVTGGAGQIAGPAALCARLGLEPAGLEIALRDLDDLAGNARRVVTAVDAARAAGDLAEDVPVHVELPQADPSYAWLAAADEVAAAELRLKFRTGGVDAHHFPTAPRLSSWIDAALDRETPFKCTAGLHHAVRHTTAEGFVEPVDQHGFLNVLLATRLAFDGASQEDVVAALEQRDAGALAAAAREADLAGARRWFTSFGSCSVQEPLDDLIALGLLEQP